MGTGVICMSRHQWMSIVIIFLCWVVMFATGHMPEEEWAKPVAIGSLGGILLLSALQLRKV